MLLSMTGFGEARRETDAVTIAVEVRAVNNRYLKVMTRSPDAYTAFESEVEKIVRRNVTRGTVNVTIRASLAGALATTQINADVVKQYWSQLEQLSPAIGASMPKDVIGLLSLPNTLSEGQDTHQSLREHWPAVAETLDEAVTNMNAFRLTEGKAMAVDLATQCELIANQLTTIQGRTPQIVADYRDRILERVRELVGAANVTVEETDLIREVSVFAERCDINEEVKRLQSHIEQFEAFLSQDTSQGRKVEFLIQEMFRETNTIGSKANDVQIAHAVVEMKSAIEKMREMVQNIE